jgi:hypothetical protein
MWGTTSSSDELTGDFGDRLEATSIGDCPFYRLLAENYSYGILGLLQQYRHEAEVLEHAADFRLLGSSEHAQRTRRRPASAMTRRGFDAVHAGPRAGRAVHVVASICSRRQPQHFASISVELPGLTARSQSRI